MVTSLRAGRALVVGALVAASLLCAGCARGDADAPPRPEELTVQELDSRPTIDEVMDSYDVVLTEMRDAVSAEFPGGTWRNEEGRTHSHVPATPQGLDARRGWSGIWVFDQSVATDAGSKQRIVDLLDAVLTRHGFKQLVVFIDREGELETVTDDVYGGRIYFGSQEATVLRYVTDCHWPSTH